MANRLAGRCEDFAVCALGPLPSNLGKLGFELSRPPPNIARPSSRVAWVLDSLRARRFDAVLGSDWLSASLGLAWRGRSGLRRVFTAVHGPELDWRRAGPGIGHLYRKTAELTLRRADTVFAASGSARVALANVHVRRVELLGRACDPERYHPVERGTLARELGVFDRRVLASVGRLVPERRIDKVLFALSALGVRYPDLCYVIAGDGPERPRLELLAERLRIAHRVRFLGRVSSERLPEVYNLCDVFVHLSGGPREIADYDGSALLEALASARPAIVTSRWASIEDIDEQAVSMVPEDDSMAFGEALTALLDRPDRARRLGERARAWVLSAATWDRAAERLLEAMTDATRGERPERDGGTRPAISGAVFAGR
jgi:glycosyltransferase involved in cell wall biosynthesis